MPTASKTNFGHLERHSEQLVRLGMLAEKYFPDDPNTSLLKMRQFAELLAQLAASHAGLYVSSDESQYELLRRLQDEGLLPTEAVQLFGQVRRTGNAASHEVVGDHRIALATLKLCWQLGIWFQRAFGDARFRPGAFVPPADPAHEEDALRAELEQLRESFSQYEAAHRDTAEHLAAVEAQLADSLDEQSFWQQMAIDADGAKAALERQLATQQAEAEGKAAVDSGRLRQAVGAATAAIELDEADTRQIIDQQLRDAGWEADTATLRYGKGTRPEKGHNCAIAEWPTASGPADYVLFIGLTPVATVEAKRKNIDVSASLQQSRRYSEGFRPTAEMDSLGGPWGDFRVPFLFSANGRPFLRQLATRSGIWFRDARRVTNTGRALDAWPTPDGLRDLLARDEEEADKHLKDEPFNYGFPLRDYQKAAILAAEEAIATGQRDMLLAMATGTGKTKTCVALIYRLLKAKRFRRVLFLVDRSALGEQAANAFKDTRMESLQNFADIFGIKELDEQTADPDTMVHIATVQGMVRRVLNPAEGTLPPPVDEYDCVIVDECHRGYLLDRELSDTELEFRSFDDYVSKYRRVLDHFDAVRIGLTATPALHTTQIFGPPIYTYSYREAVIDGFLVDHEPPIQIHTELSESGIRWELGEEVKVYDPAASQLTLFTTPDEISLSVDDFNRKVITEAFNRVVCEVLAREIDPAAPGKTLIFCANDAHADLVVALLKEAFEERYGDVEDDAVMKITGAADKPLGLIRRYKNERNPNVAVTVDLLTTGVDVPAITNLVFLRRVNSRILFDQMLGRATRLCEDIGKETFRIFDAVRLYEALEGLTAMTPVVANPNLSFSQLIEELSRARTDEEQVLVRDQLIAKLQRKKNRLSESAAEDFEVVAGMSPVAFVEHLRRLPVADVASWFTENPELGEILDRTRPGRRQKMLVSEHEDELRGLSRGYGAADKPEDYLDGFRAYIKDHMNDIPALLTVVTRPRELTRKDLRELAIALDREGYSEANLSIAWREMTNQDIAARIVGFVRQAALGDPLVPYDQRVEAALGRLLVSQSWTGPQRDWLRKIAAQTVANGLVDAEALDDPDLLFQREGGGTRRLDKVFDGQLQAVLETFNEYLWETPVA